MNSSSSNSVESSTATVLEGPPTLIRVPEHTVEVVSDSGEGAQKCGQLFGRT